MAAQTTPGSDPMHRPRPVYNRTRARPVPGPSDRVDALAATPPGQRSSHDPGSASCQWRRRYDILLPNGQFRRQQMADWEQSPVTLLPGVRDLLDQLDQAPKVDFEALRAADAIATYLEGA